MRSGGDAKRQTAGMAVFAMSCSENGEDPGGKITGFDLTDSADGVTLKGKVEADEGNTIEAITFKAGSKDVDFVADHKPTFTDLKTFDLVGKNLSRKSAFCEEQSGKISLKITVRFSSGDDASETATTKIDCDETGRPVPPLVEGEYTLSSNGESYLQIDEDGQISTKKYADITSNEVSAMAYFNSSAGNKIWNPCEASGANTDKFSPKEENCTDGRIFKTRTDCEAGTPKNGEANIDIVKDGTFWLESDNLDVFKVTIKDNDLGWVTVKLEPDSDSDFVCSE